MHPLLLTVLATWLAGATAPLGGLLALLEGSAETERKQELVHGVVAFGGGILIAAVAFALVPEGMALLSPLYLATVLLAGGLVFCFIDAWLSTHGGSKAQFMAMLMDFVPEAISLGAVFGHDKKLGLLIALFIGAQNLPEGFNAFREMDATGNKPGSTLKILLGITLLGPIAASLGYFFLQNRPTLTAGIMSFAAGGILYLIFQDIAPAAQLRRHWAPPLGAVLGFIVGIVGKQLLG